ncbi:CDP-glycerol glycerophosphotransferase family protein [Pseudomonadota bacterium]
MKNKNILFGLFLNTLLFFLSYIVPKRPGTVLLGGGLGNRFSGNPKYFYLHLCCESERSSKPFGSFAWITKNRRIYEQMLIQKRPALFAWSFKGFWAILRTEQLVIESGNAPGIGGHDIAYERLFPGRFNIFQTWHGTPLKHICLDVFRDRQLNRWYEKFYFWLYRRELSSLSSVLALSDIAKQRFLTGFDNQNIAILGYPKNDIFYGDPGKWKVNYRWHSFSKVLLYAPTFRDHPGAVKPFSGMFFETLNDELKSRNWCLLIKKHQFDHTMDFPGELSNIFDISEDTDDVQEVLVQSDVLISDYSSIFIDYLLRKKPVIFYIYDLESYLDKSRQMYCEFLEEVPGPFARNEKELLDLLLNAGEWFKEHRYQDEFNNALGFYHKFQDGDSCIRFQNLLLSCSKLANKQSS